MGKRKEYRSIKLNKEIKCIFGDNIKRLLNEKGLRQSDLARMMDASPQQISQYVNAVWLPSISKVFEFAQALGVQPIELLITDEAVTQLSVGRKVLDSYQFTELLKVSKKLSKDQLNLLIDVARQFS